MGVEVVVPKMGESVSSGIIAAWIVKDGERAEEGQDLFELETDKASVAVPAPASGRLKQLVAEGDEVEVGKKVAEIDTSAAGESSDNGSKSGSGEREDSMPALSPAVRRIVAEHDLNPAEIPGTGKGGRITKDDALKAVQKKESHTGAETRKPIVATPAVQPDVTPAAASRTTRVPLSPLRRKIAENLVAARQSSAHLTTFNEIDMSAVIQLRSTYRDAFEKKHGVRLGFMSFFIKAACRALQEFPQANSVFEEDALVYNNFYNIGVAVSTDRGLIVPVIRDADRKSFAEIEREIVSFAVRAREKKLTVDELSGGTFSITNGGVFGSLLSTPIPSPPQPAILGMHAIQKRPVVVDDEIVIRPMMYVALTYDHRVMDGREAVGFLVKIKNLIEDPRQLLLDL